MSLEFNTEPQKIENHVIIAMSNLQAVFKRSKKLKISFFNAPNVLLRGKYQHEPRQVTPLEHFVVVVQLLSCIRLFVTPWTTACQASLSFNISWSSLKFMSIESVMPTISSCHLLLLLPSVCPSIRFFSNESALHIRWPKYWSVLSPGKTGQTSLRLFGMHEDI